MDIVQTAQHFFQEKVDDAMLTLSKAGFKGDLTQILAALDEKKSKFINPNVQRFCQTISTLPSLIAAQCIVDQPEVMIDGVCSDAERGELESVLTGLIPWRKGPYSLFGVTIDAEWRSNIKWDRIARREWFETRRVLDVGCNSGYYMFRMAEFNPKLVLGIDPSDLFFFQYHTIAQWMPPSAHLAYLPITLEQLIGVDHWFDTIVCMGILYHQRSPIEALRGLRNRLRRKGTLILETIVIGGEGDYSITPKTSYAKMANVYYLPTVSCLITWLERAGFTSIIVVDLSVTTSDEQRKTEWVNTESFADFVMPDNPSLTVEGYPAPHRVVISCHPK